jgi:hypothetical protein
VNLICLLLGRCYRSGDPPPRGYLAWHVWAEAQRRSSCAPGPGKGKGAVKRHHLWREQALRDALAENERRKAEQTALRAELRAALDRLRALAPPADVVIDDATGEVAGRRRAT